MTGRFSRRSLLRVVGALPGIGALSAHTAAAEEPSAFIVGTGSRAADRAVRSRAASVDRELDFGEIGRAVAGRFSPEARDALRNRADVRYVERDGTVEPLAESLPWGVDRVDADVAHSDGATGDGADIAVIDSGIDADHPDLQTNLGEGYAVETCSGCTEPWDDDHGHGTHCAGIADAVDNEEGVLGVSTEATLHAVKVFTDDSYATVSGLSEGIQWVADQGHDVGSMSLGATSDYSTIRDACQYAAENGVFLVAAAGNDGSCSNCVRYPAAYSTVVAVSATTDDDELAYFSSQGPEVELAAPGYYIYSTVPDGYGSKSGTSMACPHVAGAAGQLMANGYSRTEARTRLRETAEDIGLTDDEQGYGLLDVEAAVGGSGGDSSPAVTTGSATEVGETAATLNGTLDDLGGATDAEVSFEWGESGGNLPNVTAGQSRSSTGEFEETIADLSAGTEYAFRAVADAADGDTDTGSERTFTTGTADTAVAVTTGDATNVGETDASLNGTLDDLGGADTAEVSFDYRETGTSEWSGTAAESVSTTGSFDATVSGLAGGTDYEFRAVADASDGDSSTGQTHTFTTSTADTAVAVTTDDATNVGETAATLNGTLDDLGGATDAEVSFEWGESGGDLPNTTAGQTRQSTGEFGESVTDLSAGTEYAFRAVADAADGDTDTGSERTFTTTGGSSDAAPAIDSYSVSEAGSPNPHAEITADWTVSDVDGDLASVLVEVLDSAGTVAASARTSVGGTGASGTDEFKLKHAGKATFDVRLTVVDDAGHDATRTETVSS